MEDSGLRGRFWPSSILNTLSSPLRLTGLLFAIGIALALRCPRLDVRPMHNDEAVNAIKLRTLWDNGVYQYDPNEYHGPTLPYLSLAWAKLTGTPNFV